MLAQRRFPPQMVIRFGMIVMTPPLIWGTIVFGLYGLAGWHFLRIPFLPLSTMGIAVAFYVGFKNNSAYDRFWEGRKIWGAVVNSSRTWGTNVVSYVRPGDDSAEAQDMRRELVYRHLAWMNALRLQLRKKSRFFHKPARSTKQRLERHAEHMRNDWELELTPFLEASELEAVSEMANPATQMLTKQGLRLADELRDKKIDLFHQIAMMGIVEELYTLQGKCERIKNTPFPRQYAEYSRIFTRAFVILMPFGLLDVFHEYLDSAVGTGAVLMGLIPALLSYMLIAWVFQTMEGIGDSSEDPFERSFNDVPMNALCRTIERDLRQMLGEPDDKLPPSEQAIDGILY